MVALFCHGLIAAVCHISASSQNPFTSRRLVMHFDELICINGNCSSEKEKNSIARGQKEKKSKHKMTIVNAQQTHS